MCFHQSLIIQKPLIKLKDKIFYYFLECLKYFILTDNNPGHIKLDYNLNVTIYNIKIQIKYFELMLKT